MTSEDYCVMLPINGKRGYEWHWVAAMKQWMELNKKCCKEILPDLVNFYEEEQYIEEHFNEMEQVKIIYDYELREHMLKIKWENFSCWWADCQCLGLYYCVMLPIDSVDLKTPYALAMEAKQ